LGRIFARSRSEVTQSWFDFHSIGHFVMGIITFFATFSIYGKLLMPFTDALSYAFSSTLVIGLMFEIIENTILVPIKFDGRKDSTENSLMDILMVGIGGGAAYPYCMLTTLSWEEKLLITLVVSFILLGIQQIIKIWSIYDKPRIKVWS
jgi:hypothetical protein